eukprot:1158671-Pelagomonas_calceolata.AAC.4
MHTLAMSESGASKVRRAAPGQLANGTFAKQYAQSIISQKEAQVFASYFAMKWATNRCTGGCGRLGTKLTHTCCRCALPNSTHGQAYKQTQAGTHSISCAPHCGCCRCAPPSSTPASQWSHSTRVPARPPPLSQRGSRHA